MTDQHVGLPHGSRSVFLPFVSPSAFHIKTKKTKPKQAKAIVTEVDVGLLAFSPSGPHSWLPHTFPVRLPGSLIPEGLSEMPPARA